MDKSNTSTSDPILGGTSVWGTYLLSYSVLYVLALLWYLASVLFSSSWNRHVVSGIVSISAIVAFPVLTLVTISSLANASTMAFAAMHGIGLALTAVLFAYYMLTSVLMAMTTGTWKAFVPFCNKLMVYRTGTHASYTIMPGVPSVLAVVIMDNVHWLQDGFNTPIGGGALGHTPETLIVVKPFRVVHYTRFALTALDGKDIEHSTRGIAMYKADRSIRMRDFKQVKDNSAADVALHME